MPLGLAGSRKVPARSTAAPARRSRVPREVKWALVFISPGAAYFFVFWIYPVLLTAYQSAFEIRGRRSDFVGLDNYARLLTDPLFHQSVLASLVITAGIVVATMVIAMGLALLLNDESLKGRRWFRLAIFVPVVTDWVATGLIWQLIFLPNQGVLAGLAAGAGFTELVRINWISSRQLAPIAVIVFAVWKTVGLYMIILLAGLKTVPIAYVEAARLDGAGPWQLFRHVILPLLMPLVIFVLIVSFVSGIGLFEPVFMLTGGGPADATKTLPLFLHEQYFIFRKGGYASAVGIVFLFLTLAFAIFAAFQLKRLSPQEGP